MNRYGERINKTTVRFERLLPGPIERVWAYLIEPDKRALWFAAGRTELKPGGKAEFHFDHRRITNDKPPKKYEKHGGEMKFDGMVVEADPPRLLVFDWPEETGESTRVRIELERAGDKVKLTLTHSMLEKRAAMISISGGWHIHLDLLEAVLTDAPRPAFWAAIERLEAEYEERHGA